MCQKMHALARKAAHQSGSWLNSIVGVRRYPIALFTLFNFADLGGKSLPMWRRLVFHDHRGILRAALLRLIFIPAFLVAAWLSSGPVIIGLLTLILGLSNGYCTALAMMNAPIGLEVRDSVKCLQAITCCPLSCKQLDIWQCSCFHASHHQCSYAVKFRV